MHTYIHSHTHQHGSPLTIDLFFPSVEQCSMATMHLLVRMYVASYTAKITYAANEVLVNAIRTCSDVAILYSLVPRPFPPPVFDWLQIRLVICNRVK